MEHAAEYEAEVEATFAARTFEEWCDVLARLVDPVGARAVSKRGRGVTRKSSRTTTWRSWRPRTAFPTPSPTHPLSSTRHRPVRDAAPSAGQHTEEVMLELGLTWDEIIELKLAEILA